jgi:hypothetical protein
MSSLEELFCSVDDFCQIFEPLWHQKLLGDGIKHRRRPRQLRLSEIMTILIAFHLSKRLLTNSKISLRLSIHGIALQPIFW